MGVVIGIVGSYGGLNVGDEAILTSAVAQLRANEPDCSIVVFSRNAEHTREHHDVDRAINARTALRDEVRPEIASLDMLLLGGGGILYDREARLYLKEVSLAHELGIPTFAFAVGIGPLSEEDERRAVREGLDRMAGITVREVSAKRLCQEIGVSVPIEVTADPAFLLEPLPFTDEMLDRESIPRGRPLIGFSVRERGGAAPDLDGVLYHQLLSDVADYCTRRYDAEAVFVPMEKADRNEIHQVISTMVHSDRAHVLRGDYRPGEIRGLVERFDLVAGMRLHFLIFAASAGVPLMPLPYASKVGDLIASLGITDAMSVAEARVGTFLADLDALWDGRRAQQKVIGKRLPAIRQLAARTAPLALATIGRGPEVPPDVPPGKTGEKLANPQLAY